MDGVKNFEWRKNDRNYKVGDEFNGREYDPHQQTYTGRQFTRRINYVLGEGFGVPQGFVVLSLEVPGFQILKARAFAQAAEMARAESAKKIVPQDGFPVSSESHAESMALAELAAVLDAKADEVLA